jgi:hypothetical protein
MTAKQIEAAALKLSRRTRARLVYRLIESLRTKREREILDLWIAEVERRSRDFEKGVEEESFLGSETYALKSERRMQDVQSGCIEGIPAQAVFKRIRASLRRPQAH